MDVQRKSPRRPARRAGAGARSGPEKISLYVFPDTVCYVEFVRSVENREVETGIEGHGRLDVEQPYVAAIDPLNGREEIPGRDRGGLGRTTRRAGKSKKPRRRGADRRARPLARRPAVGEPRRLGR